MCSICSKCLQYILFLLRLSAAHRWRVDLIVGQPIFGLNDARGGGS